ncbi:DUF4129 domain-containing protein [Deinococcus irradiatisoli]|nr:DUF4129 domain-containing protein [Deinococcus irradiatisoli]
MPERSLLLAALPWTALGLQAWWLCLLQSLGVWLSLKSRSRAALPLGLLLLALAAALLNMPDVRRAALTFVITGPLSLLLAAGILGARTGRRWALALPAAALLIGPSFVGALALLVGALGLGNPDERSSSQPLRPSASPRPLGWLLGAALLIAAFAALPRPSLPHLDRTPIDVVERVTAPGAKAAAPRGSRTPRPGPAQVTRPPRPDHSLQTLLNAATLPLLGMLLLCLAILRRGWGRGGPRAQPLLAVLTLALLLAAGLFVLGLLLQPQAVYRVVGQIVTPGTPEPPAGRGPAAAAPPPAAALLLPDWLIWSVSVLGLLLLAGAAWFVLSLKEPPEDQPEARPVPETDTPAEEALGRVRAAYAATLRRLASRGLSRATHETPDEFLRRAAARWPELQTPLAHLTGAYRPVRYGGAVDESQAAAAERAAADVQLTLLNIPDSSERQP